MTSSSAESHDNLLKASRFEFGCDKMDRSAEEYVQMSDDCVRVERALLELYNLKVPGPDHDQKSVKKADSLRQEGNQFLSVNNDRTLALYTESIAHAPTNSTALPFGYANRAVVLSTMGRTMDAIADNQRAILTGYPESLQYKVLARLGKCYETLGQYGKSLKCLNAALKGVETSELSEEAKEKFVMGHIQPTIDACHTAGEEDEEELWNWTDEPMIGVLKLDVPSLGNSFNPELPGASEDVVLKYSKTFGRHLVATKDFHLGDVLLVEEQYAAVLMEGSFYTHCSHCMMRCRTLQPCPTCSWAMYCCGKCMSEAEVYHKLECAYIPPMLTLEPKSRDNSTYMLAIRVVTRYGLDFISNFLASYKPVTFNSDEDYRTAGFNKDGKYISSDVNTIANLYSHPVKNKGQLLQSLRKTVELMKIMGFDKLDCSYELGGFMFRFYANCMYNGGSVLAEYILKDGGDEDNAHHFYALGICPTYALINQNCMSNVFSQCYGNTHVIRAFRTIKKGDQLFVSKGAIQYLKVPLEKRTQLCKEVWNFTCSCRACVEKWPLETGHPVLPKCFMQDRKLAGVVNDIQKYDICSGEVTPEIFRELKKIHKVFEQTERYQHCMYYHRLLEVLRNFYLREGCRVNENNHFPTESVFFPRTFKKGNSQR